MGANMRRIPVAAAPRRSRMFYGSAILAVAVAALVLAPAVGGVPGDPPNVTPHIFGKLGAKGWYVSKVTINWEVHADDPIRNETGCDAITLTADTPGTKLTCSASTDCCTTSVTKTIKLDKTPPKAPRVKAIVGNRTVVLKWAVSPDTKLVQVTRRPGRRGANAITVYTGNGARYRDRRLTIGKRYRYTVAALDEAGNRGSKTRAVTAAGPLFAPAPGARVTSPPLLRWTAVKGASYYNVQLTRGGQRILSTWPGSTHFQLPRSWVSGGRRYRLQPGTYRWYVWPGFGRRSANRYGQLVGVSFFSLAR
jgi:hypothetical protein